MDCEEYGGITICGNFAERLEEKPADFDYMTTGKWYEPYPFETREKIGHVICSCKRVKVDFAPYYGWDMWHEDSCNLMRQLKAKPQLANLWQYSYLPAIYPASDVPADKPVPLWIDTRSRRATIKVRRILPQMPLPLFGGLV